MIFYYLRISAKYKLLSYDLEEYLLAGKRLSHTRFILATTTVSFLGLMTLPHMGLFYRGGFSYGFTALAAIIVPLTSALFARRLWILGRIYNPLTPARLLGDYYGCNAIRSLTVIVAILVALSLTIMSLRFGASLVQGLLGDKSGSATVSIVALLTMALMAALLFYHTAYGGMGAVLRAAVPAGVALVIALVLATLMAVNALEGFGSFFDHLGQLQQDQITAPFFAKGAFFDPLTAAAPSNMAWPGIMVASCLIALAGLATVPASLMISFTSAKGKSHASAQFFAAALLTGFILLTITIIIALAARLSPEVSGLPTSQLGGVISPLQAGDEPRMIIQLLLATPLGTPLVLGLITLSMLAALVASSAVSLMAAGGMISNDIFYERLKKTHQLTYRKPITRYAIGALVIIALLVALQKPEDPLPLFLLAGAFGLQLTPALIGLCYFKGLSGRAVRNGLIAGLFAVIATSTIAQGLADMANLSWPFGAWPLSMHPAGWGLGANLAVLLFSSVFRSKDTDTRIQEKLFEHQRSYHVLPDGQPLMPKDAGKWRGIALLIGALFVLAIALPLTSTSPANLFPLAIPSLWGWQFLSWIIGLALVYVVAYRLQPTFDPEQALEGVLNPQRRRFRVKAQTRKVETPVSEFDPNDIEKK